MNLPFLRRRPDPAIARAQAAIADFRAAYDKAQRARLRGDTRAIHDAETALRAAMTARLREGA